MKLAAILALLAVNQSIVSAAAIQQEGSFKALDMSLADFYREMGIEMPQNEEKRSVDAKIDTEDLAVRASQYTPSFSCVSTIPNLQTPQLTSSRSSVWEFVLLVLGLQAGNGESPR